MKRKKRKEEKRERKRRIRFILNEARHEGEKGKEVGHTLGVALFEKLV